MQFPYTRPILAIFILTTLAAPSPAPVHYTDITLSSHVNFVNHNSPTSQKYLLEAMTGGVAIIDFDNDGWPDLFFVNGAQLNTPQRDDAPLVKTGPEFWNRLYRNNHDGTFTDFTVKAGLQGQGYGMGAAVADYDNDGFPDLLVTNYGGCILYRNNGDGTFTDVTKKAGLHTEGWQTSAGFFDYNNDGKLDLFICRYVQWNFAANTFCGLREAGGRSYCHPDNYKPISNYLFRNNGDGTFTDVSESSHIKASAGKALGLAFADFNQDGWMDITVANDSFQQFLFMNNGNGTFTETAVIAGTGYTDDGKVFAGMGTDAADIDGDGYPDIVTTALSNESYAYFRNNRDGTFDYATNGSRLGEITRSLAGWGVRIFDYDNDGENDLFFANGHVMDNIHATQPHLQYAQPPLLLKQESGKFYDVSPRSGSAFQRNWASRGAAVADLDNDGDLDIVVNNSGGAAYILRNDGGNRNSWIGLNLRGKKSNRDGIGARVTLISAAGKSQHKMVTAAASYLSSQDRRLFFGIGTEDHVKEILIRWPSGIKQTIANPAIRQILTIEESAS